MSNKIVIAAIVIVLILAATFFLFKNNAVAPTTPPGTQQTQQNQPAQTNPTSTTQTTTQPSDSQDTVTLTATGFSPDRLTVKAGTKVTWVNQSGETAQVDSNPHPVHTDYPPLNLGTVENGSNVSLTFPTPGIYGYHNHLNPSEKGTIVVQ